MLLSERQHTTASNRTALRSARLHRSIPRSLQDLSTLKDTNQYHHDRDDQENVNDSAQCVRRNQPKQPENDQYDRYRLEHSFSPSAATRRRLESHTAPAPRGPTVEIGGGRAVRFIYWFARLCNSCTLLLLRWLNPHVGHSVMQRSLLFSSG